MLIPIQVNTLIIRSPWANISLIVLTVAVFVFEMLGWIPDRLSENLVLTDWSSPLGLIGHMFLHAGWMHLIGNMIFMWVFGNALNGVMHHKDYVFVYLLCGIAAGAMHLVLDGHPAVGASGAICGLTGMYLAIYPKNEITCWYWFFLRGGFIELKGFLLVIGWFLWDLWSAFQGSGHIASWAHVGGAVSGFMAGIVLLKLQRIHLGEYDNTTILDLLPRGAA